MGRLLLCSGREDNEGSREEKAKGWPRRRQREREEREKSQRYTQATFHARFRVAANERDCVSPASSARFMLMSKQMAGLEWKKTRLLCCAMATYIFLLHRCARNLHSASREIPLFFSLLTLETSWNSNAFQERRAHELLITYFFSQGHASREEKVSFSSYH